MAFIPEHINDFGGTEDHIDINSRINTIIVKLDTVQNDLNDSAEKIDKERYTGRLLQPRRPRYSYQ